MQSTGTGHFSQASDGWCLQLSPQHMLMKCVGQARTCAPCRPRPSQPPACPAATVPQGPAEPHLWKVPPWEDLPFREPPGCGCEVVPMPVPQCRTCISEEAPWARETQEHLGPVLTWGKGKQTRERTRTQETQRLGWGARPARSAL